MVGDGISTVTADFSSDILALNVTACSLMLPWIFQLFSRPIHLCIYEYRVSLVLRSKHAYHLVIKFYFKVNARRMKGCRGVLKIFTNYYYRLQIWRKSKCKLKKNSVQLSPIYMLHRKIFNSFKNSLLKFLDWIIAKASTFLNYYFNSFRRRANNLKIDWIMENPIE